MGEVKRELNHLSINHNEKNDQAMSLYHSSVRLKEFCAQDVQFVAKQLGKARPEGDGWRCLCPAHDDHNPSLSLRFDETRQTFLVKCWAGCPFEYVLAALKNRGLLGECARSCRKVQSKE